MVHGHELDRLAAEQADAVELALVQHEFAEAQVIRRGGHKTAAARVHLARGEVAALAGIVDQFQLAARAGLVVGREALVLVGRHVEVGVDHAQRGQHLLLEIDLIRLAGNDLDQITEHIGRDAIIPGLAGLGDQREGRELLDDLLETGVGGAEVDAVLGAIERVDRVALHEAVGQARGVGQQVAEVDLALGRRRIDLAAAAAGIDARVGEGGDELRDRVVELKAALFVEHHDRRRGERLGHGIDPEDRVGPHRLVALDVGLAAGLGEGELALAHDHGHHAGQAAAVDPAVHPFAHAVEPLSGKTDLFGGDERQGVHGDPPR